MKKWAYSLAILTFMIFTYLFFSYEKDFVIQLDHMFSKLLAGNDFITLFHYIGETKFIIFVALLLLIILWLRQRNYRAMIFVLLTIALGNVLNQLVKNWIQRPRPELLDQLTSYSFPSGHAMIGLLYIFTIAYLLSKALKTNNRIVITIWVVAVFLTFLTGLSRVSESRHYISDVIAGWSLGYSWFILCVIWYESTVKKVKRNS
ncbi:undecaprenyl-diphosphatase [Lysinibacillus composti]|uniref:Phosphatase PAP2 family protein n=1 Tax=Lysinibacillus composti TaxID=720633 RepID=A0A3N9UC64_9BACI|nr:phosphatase PAP2 family protein [Lysinibacillus composti]MBM7609593.1 undecaprenyl-diphosphatase [Lysinibacillus composti]RQW73931.1 phosphatase PAP2 family protein [Lysinibacillus composti]